jgi:hypothetical protein
VQTDNIHVVTGAYGFSGKYIARRLLEAGYQVRTLTNSISRENPFGADITAYPFHFDRPEKMIESLRGASVLYNNYWVRSFLLAHKMTCKGAWFLQARSIARENQGERSRGGENLPAFDGAF